MINETLKGKTVMIASSSELSAIPYRDRLEAQGAKVVFASQSPHDSQNISSIVAETLKSKADAILLIEPGIEKQGSMISCLGIANNLKTKANIPMIIVNTTGAPKKGLIGLVPLREAAECFYSGTETNAIYAAIAEAVKGKSLKRAG